MTVETIQVPEFALAVFLGFQAGEVEVLETTHVHNDPDLLLVSYALRSQDGPVHSLYVYWTELEPYLDQPNNPGRGTATKWLDAVERLGVLHPSAFLRGDGRWIVTSPPGGLDQAELYHLADIMDKWAG